MYYEDDIKVRVDWKNLLIKLVLIILAVLLIIWFFPMPKLDTFYNKIYNENLESMKKVSENYFVGNKLPEATGSTVTLKLQDMLDKKLITSFTDKNNNECSTTNSFAQVTKTEDNNYVLKVQLSCDEQTDYILENLTGNTSAKQSTATSTSSEASNSSEGSTKKTSTTEIEDDGIEIDGSILDGSDPKYDKDASTTEYQYKREIIKKTSTYVCPDGYVKEGNSCYRYEDSDVIPATALYFDDEVHTIDAKKNEGKSYTVKAEVIKTVDKQEKVCPEGYTLNGNICYKYVNATVVPGTTTYSCPQGWTLNGTSCTITTTPITNQGKTTYSCPSGYVLNGTKCTLTIDASASTAKSTEYTCPNGGKLNGKKCEYKATKKTTSGSSKCSCPSGYSDNGSNCVKKTSAQWHNGETSYGSCPSGFSPSGNQCVKKTTYSASASSSWSNPSVTNSKTQLSTYENSSSKRILVNTSCNISGCTYTYHTYTKNTTYSCPNGGTLSGTSCVKTETRSRTTSTSSGYYTCNGSKTNSSTCYSYANKSCTSTSGKTTYSCPNGGKLKDKTCTYDATKKTKTGETTYSCPSGYTKSGTKCSKTIDATSSTSATSYSCPAGYTLSGNTCIKTQEAEAYTSRTEYSCPEGYVKEGTTCYQYKEPTDKVTYKYSCPEGYVKSGEGESTVCSKTMQTDETYYCENAEETLQGDKCVKTIKGALRGYSCPEGYIKNGQECVKRSKECIAPQEIVSTSTSYEYKWSSETSLDGWTQTGKTRTSGTTSNNNTNLYEK